MERWSAIKDTNAHLLLVSRHSASKGDNKVKPGAVNRSISIYLMATGNPEKPQLRDRLMKVVQPATAQTEFP